MFGPRVAAMLTARGGSWRATRSWLHARGGRAPQPRRLARGSSVWESDIGVPRADPRAGDHLEGCGAEHAGRGRPRWSVLGAGTITPRAVIDRARMPTHDVGMRLRRSRDIEPPAGGWFIAWPPPGLAFPRPPEVGQRRRGPLMTCLRASRHLMRRSPRICPPQMPQDGRAATGEAWMSLPDPDCRPPRATCQTTRRPPRGGDQQGVKAALSSAASRPPTEGDRKPRNG